MFFSILILKIEKWNVRMIHIKYIRYQNMFYTIFGTGAGFLVGIVALKLYNLCRTKPKPTKYSGLVDFLLFGWVDLFVICGFVGIGAFLGATFGSYLLLNDRHPYIKLQ